MLNEIGVRYNTDKSSIAHNFLDFYEQLLYGKQINTVLEIGIYEGASLKMWAEYYHKAQIYGFDIDPSVLVNGGNIKSYLCDQSDSKQLYDTIMENGIDPDLVIEDGSHLWSHQIITFNTIFPLLKTGAIYIVEDLHTSYMPDYCDQNLRPIDYFSEMDKFTILRNSDMSITGAIVKE